MTDHTIEGWLRAFAHGRATPHDAWQACLRAIDARDGELNAIPTRRDAAAIAAELDAHAHALREGRPVGVLAGLPYVAKDIFETAGLRTTFGSPIYADHVPTRDAGIVARMRAAGAVLVGKSNTPEFAAGSQTYNPVLGATRNPHDPSRTAGGSSGGGACALATGMALVADGSDLAASLRNPASFCGVVGLRPSAYLDPTLQPDGNAFGTLNVVGPMGRSVTDTEIVFRALFERPTARPVAQWVRWLDDIVGGPPDAEPPGPVRSGATRPTAGRPRLAYSADLGGMPVERAVRDAFEAAIERLRAAGIELVEAHPDFDGADECFLALRGLYFVENFAELHAREAARMKDAVRWNIEQGLALSAADIARAHRTRGAVFRRVQAFMEGFDALLLPTAQVLPFPLDQATPTHVDGVPLANYIDWLKSCYWVTVAGHPALSIPCGFATPADGARPLPVGLQVMGRWRGESALFAVGRTVEGALVRVQASSSVARLRAASDGSAARSG